MQNYMVTRFNQLQPVACPCGFSRRAFAVDENSTATVHLLDVKNSARTHYHKKATEIYVVLEGDGHLELDGDEVAVQPMTAVFIRPGCRHKAVGNLRILNIVVPAFDEDDEWFD